MNSWFMWLKYPKPGLNPLSLLLPPLSVAPSPSAISQIKFPFGCYHHIVIPAVPGQDNIFLFPTILQKSPDLFHWPSLEDVPFRNQSQWLRNLNLWSANLDLRLSPEVTTLTWIRLEKWWFSPQIWVILLEKINKCVPGKQKQLFLGWVWFFPLQEINTSVSFPSSVMAEQ